MFDFLRGLFGPSRKSQSAADFLRAAGEAEPERQAELSVIRSCRELFGPPPRGCGPDDRVVLEPELEQVFVATNDGLLRILEDQERLLARGHFFWGQLV
jgi:hypothetical protein